MLDLSAHIFYKVHFTIRARSEAVDILQMLVKNQLQGWVVGKYSKKANAMNAILEWNWDEIISGTDSYAPGINIHSTSFNPKDVDGDYIQYWACRITERQQDHGYVPRTWVTEIGLQQINRYSGVFSFVVFYFNGTGFFGPTLPVPENNIPRLVSNVLGAEHLIVSNGSTQLDNRIHYLQAGDGPQFAELLLDPGRKSPVIMIIAGSKADDASEANIEPSVLLKNVAGNALVYYAGDPGFSDELSFFLKYQYWCKPGWVRVYNPGLDPSNPNDGEKHRYISSYDVQIRGKDTVYSIFRRIFSREFEYYNEQQMFRCENCENLKRNAQIKRMREDYERTLAENKLKDKDAKFAEEYIEFLTSENGDIERLREELREKDDEARQANAALLARQEEFDRLYRRVKDQEVALSKSQVHLSLPNTPIAIGEYYEAIYGDKIAFTERAKKTLLECNTAPDVLWDCFYHMANTLRDLYIVNDRTIDNSFKLASGFELALSEGADTRSDKELMKLRRDNYHDREIHAEPHVKKGNRDKDPLSVRVYYAFDPESTKIIVSFCNGAHLPNATTKRYF